MDIYTLRAFCLIWIKIAWLQFCNEKINLTFKDLRLVDEQRNLIEMLVARLERLSADSYWAHQASGVRGSLLRLIENDSLESSQVTILVEKGFSFLEKAAREK